MAVEIVVAGGHNVLLASPPVTGAPIYIRRVILWIGSRYYERLSAHRDRSRLDLLSSRPA